MTQTNRLIFDWTRHKSLWNWLAANPTCVKSQWPGWMSVSVMPRGQCFACSFMARLSGISRYALNIEQEYKICVKHCPINWGRGSTCMWKQRLLGDDGLFRLWISAKTDKQRADYARQIAERPLKSWVEERWLV